MFDSFLTQFPLCYGYWRKYAQLEAQQADPATSLSKGTQIFEAAVATIPYCVDIWAYYAHFLLNNAASDADSVRR